jgi:hypothetical protein
MVTMRRSVLVALALGLSADVLSSQSARPTPPPTRRDDVREVLHGVELVDPYRWLETTRARRRAPGSMPRIDSPTPSSTETRPGRPSGKG